MPESNYVFLTQDLFSKFGFGDGDMLNEFFSSHDISCHLHDSLFFETIRFILKDDLRYLGKFGFKATYVTTAHNSLRILEWDGENEPEDFDWDQLSNQVTLSEDELHEVVDEVMNLAKLRTLSESNRSVLRLLDYKNAPSNLVEELKLNSHILEKMYLNEKSRIFGEKS